MGYYSEVAIQCEEKAYERFKETFTEYSQPNEIFKDGDRYIIHWDSVKWYDYFDEVKAVTKIMDELDDECNEIGDGLGYGFMRIGEDLTDIDTRSNDYDLELYVNRSIDIPYNAELITEE